MRVHPRAVLIAVGLLCCGLATVSALGDDNFDAAPVGGLPAGWTAAKTGTGDGSVWKIQEEGTGPSRKKVLTQTSSAGPRPLFNLCVGDQPSVADLDLRISVKALSGKIDQGGGPVWRYQDENNYYVARVNPLENNFRVYKVVDGVRTQLGTADVKTATGQWHAIRIVQRGDRILCSLDGKQLLDVKDQAISAPGRIGFWTKADAVSSFTAPVVADVSATAAPSQVLVVNTQDASVSLVDLTTMKEVARHPVGPRPYGIAVTRDGKTVAVGVEDEECVKFYSLPDFKLKGKAPVGKMFNDHIVLTQDGRSIMVANFYSDDVLLIDVETMKETGRIAGCSAPHVVKYGPLKQRAFVTCKKVTGIAVIDPAGQKLLKFHQLNVNPRSLTFSPDESKVYFGSFWVNGFFEMDAESGKVTRLLSLDPTAENAGDQEVTYHGVEAIGNNIVLAANEGRSYVDAVDVASGTLLDRLTTVNKPCCVERIPGPVEEPIRVLVSNIGDGTLQLVEVGLNGKMKALGRAAVGAAPKRVAFIPATAP
jgi:DNA-binding beta-propeller fold protein YncE